MQYAKYECKENCHNCRISVFYIEEDIRHNVFSLDEMENPRGYANSKEECQVMAEEQNCDKYTILEVH